MSSFNLIIDVPTEIRSRAVPRTREPKSGSSYHNYHFRGLSRLSWPVNHIKVDLKTRTARILHPNSIGTNLNDELYARRRGGTLAEPEKSNQRLPVDPETSAGSRILLPTD